MDQPSSRYLLILSLHQNPQYQIMFENFFGAQLWKCFESGISKELLDTVKYGVLDSHTGQWIRETTVLATCWKPPFPSPVIPGICPAPPAWESTFIYSFCLPRRLHRPVVVALCSGHLDNQRSFEIPGNAYSLLSGLCVSIRMRDSLSSALPSRSMWAMLEK